MPFEIRKIVCYKEITHREGGRELAKPITMLGVAAVIRNPWHGRGFVEDLSPEQRIDIASALRGFCAGAAAAAGAAHEQGTLMTGMLADLAILSADPFKISPSELHMVKSELTMIEGEIMWEKK